MRCTRSILWVQRRNFQPLVEYEGIETSMLLEAIIYILLVVSVRPGEHGATQPPVFMAVTYNC
jgi:hypothetical protein